MRRLRLLVWAAGAVFGVAAEWIYFEWSDPSDWVPDLAVGWTLIACGLVASSKHEHRRTGRLMAATGFAWFAADFTTTGLAAVDWLGAQALYLHRGPLVHLVLSYPRGRLPGRIERVAVAVGYAAAIYPPVWRSETATIVLAGMCIAVAGHAFFRAVGRERRARRASLQATAFIAALFAATATTRLAAPNQLATDASLLAYEVGLCALAAGLFAGLVVAPWDRARVTDLVVELGGARSGTLRDALARALGDPTLEVGFWLADRGSYVDATGRPLDVSSPGSGRRVTQIDRDGQIVAALVHDAAVLDDHALLDAVAAAARLAASNSRLQAEVSAQVGDLRASRRRLLEAGDGERRRLEQRLRDSAERRLTGLWRTLARAQELAAEGGSETSVRIGRAGAQLDRTLEDLRVLAAGLHPRALSESGLTGALRELAGESPVPVELAVLDERVSPQIEVAAYFVCAEALANVAKYASASVVAVAVTRSGDRLLLEVSDDGVGGADMERGTGLRGLSDRVEALGGTLAVESPSGHGTRLTAAFPLDGRPR